MATTVSGSPRFPETTPAVRSEAQEIAIRGQLDRLLSNPFFSHSRRIPAFLQYIVEMTLKGRTDLLKERTIGIEIFGKTPDYDTAVDPIVRVTAGELRKRIAQYYQEPGHQAELRLSLPTGSYVPQFHFPGSEAPLTETENPKETPASVSPPALSARTSLRRRWLIAATAALALLAAVIAVPLWRNAQRSAFDEFWGPILNSPDPVLLCVADQTQYTAISLRDAQDPERQITLKDNLTAVVIDDLSAVIKIAGVLQSSGKRYSLRGENDTTLMDLRNGPSVLIGAFDNAWTLRMLRPLRFHFANNPPEMTSFSIVDGAQHERARWILDRNQQVTTNNYLDYAIVARFTDNVTGKPTLIAAGIARGGTIAAGEFLTSPNLLQAVLRQRPSARAQNVEVVLSTQIIKGEPGTPRIEAVYFW
jgi:hypothetical protein